MVSADQIRGLVSEYLRGVISIELFSERFAVIFDDIEDSGDAAAIKLSYAVESKLADVSAGFASDDFLRESLIPCLLVVETEPEYRSDKVGFNGDATSGNKPVEVSLTA